MSILILNTSKTPEGYSASCDLLPGWVVAFTGNFDEFKEYVLESIDFFVECAKNDGEEYPAIFDEEYQISYKFDIQSLFCHYQNNFSFAALQHITGVNQRQLWHYAAGRSKPRRNQAEKIVASLNKLGKELTTLTV